MKILSRFLSRRFLSGFGIVLLLVVGIFLAITFVEQLSRTDTAMDAAITSGLSLLEYLPMFLPLTIFMGTLLAAYNLTRSSEMVIVSGAGQSPYQITRPFALTAAAIGIVAATIINPVSVKLSRTDVSQNLLTQTDGHIWMREGNTEGAFILRASGASLTRDNKMEFSDAIMLTQDADSRPTARISAKKMTLTHDGFFAKTADVFGNDGKTKHVTDWNIKTLTTPENIMERYLTPDQVSFWELPGFIKTMTDMGLNARGHLIQFWTLLFMPLTMIAMAVLGLAFSQTRQRRNYSFGAKFSVGIVVCFALYFLTNVFIAIGISGGLPTLISVAALPALILVGAAAFIVSYDRI
ncbi:MAG: LptF/LptG family permease [Rickettsiales bacterium]|jgi:lipopolysaccharide export system permease protein|nr:LptF/LptG family permease [Rickettsiales bacterium]